MSNSIVTDFFYDAEPDIPPRQLSYLPSKFEPPSLEDTPSSLFTAGEFRHPMYGKLLNAPPHHRFARRTNPQEALIFVDGACLNNGQEGAVGGCAFIFRPASLPIPQTARIENQAKLKPYGTFSFRLEDHGPDGIPYPHTSNRAELRSVTACLYFRAWHGENMKRIVIATDSTYVCDGATRYAGVWEKNGWQTANKNPVKNRDLWELLLRGVRRLAELGVDVLFWKIPRELNGEADAAAKKAALEEKACVNFRKFGGRMEGPYSMFWLEQDWNGVDEGLV